MDLELQKEITEKIESGSYYIDAQEWYARKYLFPIVERSFLIFCALTVSAVLVFSALNIRNLAIETKETPIILRVSNSTDYFSYIKPIAARYDSAQDAVVRYLLTDYVKAREEYIAQKMNDGQTPKTLLRKIKGVSDRSVLEEYRNYMSKSNPYGPSANYKDTTDRTIDISSVQFLDSDRTAGKVRVVFTATEQSRNSNTQPSMSRWEAIIHFRLPDVETIAKTGAPLRFLVKYYRVRPIQ